MMKTTATLINSVKTLKISWCLVTSVSKNVNVLSRRDAHSTIDPKDFFQVPNYNKVMDSFWDPNGIFKALHSLNYIRLPFVRDGLVDIASGEKLSTCLKGKKILEVGYGAGLFSEGLAKYGAEVTGVDTCEKMFQMAVDHSSKNKRLANNKPTYLLTNIEDHSMSYPDTYDAVVVSEVIEHVAQKELFVECCVRATKPGGKLFFTTPSRTRFAQFTLIYGFENILKCYPKGAHLYYSFMTPDELKFMLETNDCHVEDIKGYIYNPFSNHWSWIKHKQFSFAMEAVKSPNIENNNN
ncbi:ubiquinone biosynthesis O-methyltransferase, mitochondrial-like isoform X2 [Bicyclus anynana]|uniref:Ubiquinone biosynthesis O-methyltransferase, mitochondrial-like isoform X2 n=1 Tax=Bicyclus anynana TaxID=110368 RepID=A0ABM3LKS8_BICAN|nr:ubiquinone biosynthesis O-methyltransferase, mitochondrial-like isoform X2 [Bicyclus anynana]